MLQCRAYPFILFGTFKHYNPLIVNLVLEKKLVKFRRFLLGKILMYGNKEIIPFYSYENQTLK